MPRRRSRWIMLCFRERLRLFSLWSEDVKVQSNMYSCTTRLYFWPDLNAPSELIVGVGSGSENSKSRDIQHVQESQIERDSDLAVCACVCMRVVQPRDLEGLQHVHLSNPFSPFQYWEWSWTILRILWQPTLFPFLETWFTCCIITFRLLLQQKDMNILCSSKVSSVQLWKSWKIASLPKTRLGQLLKLPTRLLRALRPSSMHGYFVSYLYDGKMHTPKV